MPALLRRLLSLLLVLALGATACTPSSSTPVPQTGPRGLTMVADVHGDLSLKRSGWTAYAPAHSGTLLERGDLLRVGPDANATVVCSDLSVASVAAATSGVPCVPGGAITILIGRDNLAVPRAGRSADVDYPRVIAPRATALRQKPPTIRWTPIAGSAWYQITVDGETGRGPRTIWQRVVPGTSTSLRPTDWPALEPGVQYRVTVTTERGGVEQAPGRGFHLLDPRALREVGQSADTVQGLGLSGLSTGLVLTHLYVQYELYADAIDQLEQLSQSDEQAAVARLYGDVLVNLGLEDVAVQRYAQSLEAARADDDTEAQALAEEALARVYQQSMGHNAEAAPHYAAAIELYQELGNASKVRDLQRQQKTSEQ